MLIIASVIGFDLKCLDSYESVAYLGYTQYCQVHSFKISSSTDTVTSVNGDPLPSSTQSIYFHKLVVPHLPKGLGKMFPDLRELAVSSSGLKSIAADDLKDMPALLSLYINDNPITSLSSDLFKFTPNIGFVGFTNNKITIVGEDLLTNVTSLSQFDFAGNKCISRSFTSDFEASKALLQAKCPDRVALKKKYCSEDFEKYEKEISDLKAEIEEIKRGREV